MRLDSYAVLGSVVLSLCVMPAVVFYLLVVSRELPVEAVGLLAMVPGFLLGGTALWVAARG